MWGPIIGAGISAAGNLLGGLLGNSQSAANNAAQMAFGRDQLAFQRELATQGIRWKVADAKLAGVHPLFALGAPPFHASPISVQTDSPDTSYLGRMGQDIGRAVQATMTKEERQESVYDMVRQRQQLERGDLENQLLAAQIAKTTGQLGPPMPGGVGGATSSGPGVVSSPALGVYENKPTEVGTTQPGAPAVAAGPAQPSIQWTRTPTGYSSQPPKSGKEEDEFGAPMMTEWLVRNRLMPMAGATSMAPPMSVVRKDFPGATGVYWDYLRFEWRPTYHPSGKGAVGRYIDWRSGR